MSDYTREARRARSQGDFQKAGDMFLLAGNETEALEMYLKGRHFGSAARMFEKIEDFRSAARYYAQAENFMKSAELYVRLEDFQSASLMFEKSGELARGSEAAQKAGNLQRAAELADHADQHERAAQLYVQTQNYERASELYSYLLNRMLAQTEGEFMESHQRAIQRFGTAAGKLFMKLGNPEKAAIAFEQAGVRDRAAEAFVAIGKYEKAAEHYIALEDFSKAAAMFQKSGKLNRALQFAEKGRDFVLAASIAEQTKQMEKAASYYVHAGQIEKAASIYFQLLVDSLNQPGAASDRLHIRKLANAAASLYLKIPNTARAAWCFEQAENFARAAELYEQNSNPRKAAEMFSRAGQPAKAYELLKVTDAGMETPELLAHSAYGAGNYAEAADIYFLCGKRKEAAAAYEKAGNFYKAAVIYEDLGEDLAAAKLYGELKELKRAANLYERAGNFMAAARCLEDLGSHRPAGELFRRAGDLFSAARMFRAAGNPETAIECLQEITSSDTTLNQNAAFLSAECFFDLELYPVAVQRFQDAIGDQTPSQNNLQLFYEYARALEEHGQFSQAHDIYQRIVAIQLNFQDAYSRLEKTAGLRGSGETEALEADSSLVRRVMQRYRVTGAEPPAKQLPSGTNLQMTQQHELDLSGKRVREYEILEVLGKGGMGAVYKARHIYLDRIRAIKVVHPRFHNLNFSERFIREAKLLSSLKSPYLVQLYEFGTLEENVYFMVLEFFEGESVKARVQRDGRLPVSQSLEIISQAASGLLVAHDKGIIHRDISPDNLLIGKDELGNEIIKVIDFGIAKSTIEDAEQFTATDMFLGKPEYASPEQCGFLKEGESIDNRSDIYSLGITFYFMLTGNLPFYSPTPQGYLVKHLSQQPKKLTEHFKPGECPQALEELIMKALAKKRERRFQSLQEFLADLHALAAQLR